MCNVTPPCIGYGKPRKTATKRYSELLRMRNFHLPGRSTVHALNAMVATSHPLAALTAIEVLRSGGTAADAAVAACALLGGVQPQSTGIRGGCFALFQPGGRFEHGAYN